MADTMTQATIRPFQATIAQEDLDDLRRRITAARLPHKELVADRSQGVQLATMQELARYWSADYDWRGASRQTLTKKVRRSLRSLTSGRPAAAISWSSPHGRRRSATLCSIHRSPCEKISHAFVDGQL